MGRRPPRQLQMPFDRGLPAAYLPADQTQQVVEALAELLLAAVRDTEPLDTTHDDEANDAGENHR
ncbi:MAG TPA: hypothetical protein VES67_19975 [Vicinamibacterales bacterium]|nr:hypothetical protein [Vicinamibacterales bacterium]